MVRAESSSASLIAPLREGIMTQERQASMKPEQALRALVEGNARFVAGRLLERDLRAQAAVEEQYPFAAIVSCIDSRTSNEILFDQGPGDIFSSRIAGNVIDNSVLGGLEFACRVAGARTIVVVGHTRCGAVKGAIDRVRIGHLTGLLGRIEPAVAQVIGDFPQRTSADPDLVDAVTHANVRLSMRRIAEKSRVLRTMLEAGEIVIAGAVVDLATGRATFLQD